jgi:hypothetical protein
LPTDEPAKTENDPPADPEGREKAAQGLLARALESGEGVAGALRYAQTIPEGILRDAPLPQLKALLERVFSGRGLYLYVR